MMIDSSGGLGLVIYSGRMNRSSRTNRLKTRVKIRLRGWLNCVMRRGRQLASRPSRPAWVGARRLLWWPLSLRLGPMPSRVFWCVLSSRLSFMAFRQFNPYFLSLWIIPAKNSNSPKLIEIISNNLLCFYWWSFSCIKLTVCDRW
jgi:hypothetical protein